MCTTNKCSLLVLHEVWSRIVNKSSVCVCVCVCVCACACACACACVCEHAYTCMYTACHVNQDMYMYMNYHGFTVQGTASVVPDTQLML